MGDIFGREKGEEGEKSDKGSLNAVTISC